MNPGSVTSTAGFLFESLLTSTAIVVFVVVVACAQGCFYLCVERISREFACTGEGYQTGKTKKTNAPDGCPIPTALQTQIAILLRLARALMPTIFSTHHREPYY